MPKVASVMRALKRPWPYAILGAAGWEFLGPKFFSPEAAEKRRDARKPSSSGKLNASSFIIPTAGAVTGGAIGSMFGDTAKKKLISASIGAALGFVGSDMLVEGKDGLILGQLGKGKAEAKNTNIRTELSSK